VYDAPVRETEIDGVPVFWQEAPGPLTAGLVFGCGTRDETFMTVGVTHLVEHLVMSTLPRVHHDHDATVDLSVTEFVATGRPEQVVAFLRAVCEGISAIPIHRLAQEAGVLEAEGGFAVHPTGAALLTRRYGARDVGLEVYAGPGYQQLPADAVLAHAAKFFVAGNAALWLTGQPPEGLRLPLPHGQRGRRIEPAEIARDGPRWSEEVVPASGVLLSGARDPAWNIGMAVLGERLLAEARHQRGLSYEVFGDVIQIGPMSRQYLLGADARQGQDGVVAEILWEQLRRLAAEGPTDEELAHEKAGFSESYSDPRWAAEEAAGQARAALFDLPSSDPESRLSEIANVTREDVARCFVQALPTALIAVPEGVSVSLQGVGIGGCPRTKEAPSGQMFRMKTLVRLLTRQWRAPDLYLTGTGLARRDPDGDVHGTRFDDVIGVEVDGDNRIVFAANGCIFPVVPDAYRGGEALADVIDSAVPATLRYSPDGQVKAKASSIDTIARLGRGRPVWYRLLNGVGAVLFALSTAVLYINWRHGTVELWWVIVGVAVTLWCAWDARPARRRNIRTRNLTDDRPPTP